MPDAKQRRATVSGGSPTFERNSLMVDDPVIRPKSQGLNKAHREATLAVLAASESNLKSRHLVGEGEEEGGSKGDNPSPAAVMWRKTSSESSSGHKGPSGESEMEDSVFSSDKEDKDQQTCTTKPTAGGGAGKEEDKEDKPAPSSQQEVFRVTKPTPILLEPAPDPQLPETQTHPPPSRSPVRRTSSSSSSVSSTTSSSTLINSPHTAPKLRGLLDTSSTPVGVGGHKSRGSSDTSGSKLRPPDILGRGSHQTQIQDTNHTEHTSPPADQQSTGGSGRKHSASSSKSPSRKRSITSMFSRDSSRKASAKSKTSGPADAGKKTCGESGKKSSEKGKKTSTDSENGGKRGESERKTSVSDGSGGGKKSGSVSSGKGGKKTESVNDSGGKTAGAQNERNTNSADHSKKLNGSSDHGKKTNGSGGGEASASRRDSAKTSADVASPVQSCETEHPVTSESSHGDKASDVDADKGDSGGATESETPQPRCGSEGTEVRTRVGEHSGEYSLTTAHQDKTLSEVVASDTGTNDMPQLLKVTRIASKKSSSSSSSPETHSALKGSSEVTKKKKHVDFTPQTKDASSSEDVSTSHTAGLSSMQQVSVDKTSSGGESSSTSVRMRQKSGRGRPDRRVSCKDLGQGDCQGWLYKKKEKDRTLSRQWHKRWCVLKSFNLYYYKNKEELKAEGVIYMPAFQVSPAPELKNKKFAFKVHNSGTTFYFASERQDDMSKWMNRMGLAAISFDTSTGPATGGFTRLEPRGQHLEVPNLYYSESDDDPEEGSASTAATTSEAGSSSSASRPQRDPTITSSSTTTTTSTSSPAHSVTGGSSGGGGQGSGGQAEGGGQKTTSAKEGSSSDELHSVLRAIHSQDLTIDGVDRRKRRTRHLSSILGVADGKTDANIARLRKLLALKRTLKVKEQELQDIDRLLASHPTASRLRDFVYRHPDLRL